MSEDKKGKWEVLIKSDIITYNVGEYDSKGYKEITIEEATDEDITDSEFEISIIRANNEYGHSSWGWGGSDKIILPSEFITKAEYYTMVEIANTIVEALNKKGI